MATAEKTTGEKPISKPAQQDTATQLPTLEIPRVYKTLSASLIDRQFILSQTDILRISSRMATPDPIAASALTKVKAAIGADAQTASAVRDYVSQKGWTTELMAVNKRLNGLQIGDNKRWVLAAVYPKLLFNLLGCADESVDVGAVAEALKDTIGFTDSVLYALEEEGGVLDLLADHIVDGVCAKNRIAYSDEDQILRKRVVAQVRAGL